jgi:small subunit ribosomal protein S1
MDWTNKNVSPSRIVQLGDEVEIMVLDIDEDRRRISLGMKQCKANPWDEFAAIHKKGDRLSGTIKSITDFGVFIGLDGGIDGLVHLSDISWQVGGDEAIRNYKRGDQVESVILGIDSERERISLGIKQLEQDPFQNYIASLDKGVLVKGVIKEVVPRGAIVTLEENVDGFIRASEIQKDRVEDARTLLKEGEEVEAKFVGVDKKNKMINLSIKAKHHQEESTALKDYSSQAVVGKATLGDIFKEHMDESS